jgi:hypothetical protein
VKLHLHWRGYGSGLVHSELGQDCPDVLVRIDVICGMLPIVFHEYAEIEADTSEMMHPEPPFHLILDLPNQALVSNDTEVIDVQNGRNNNNVLIPILENQQSSVDT